MILIFLMNMQPNSNLFNSKNVIIFGGCFNPLHQGHVAIVDYCLNQLKTDLLVLLPSAEKFFGNRTLKVPTHLRLLMLEKQFNLNIFNNSLLNNKIYLSQYELKKDFSNCTLKSIKHLHELFPCVKKFNLIIGFDQALQFEKWNYWEEILTKCNVITVPRTLQYKEQVKQINKQIVVHTDNKVIDVSSTEIKKGEKWNYLSKNTLEIIHDHQLYYLDVLQYYLSPHRFHHTLAVNKYAKQLARKHKVNELYVSTAALFHDFGKELKHKDALLLMEKHFPNKLKTPPAIWHQWLSAYLLENKLYYNNQAVLTAIRHHTTPNINMTNLSKLLYCADKTSYDHEYLLAKSLRKYCLNDLNTGFQMVLFYNYVYLEKQKIKISDKDIGIAQKYLSVEQLNKLNFNK